MSDNEKEVSETHNTPKKPWGMDVNVYCMLLHLSQLAGFVIPGAGLAVPIVMWAVNKDEFPEVDLHGLIVLNWMLSALIYFVACLILMFILIGFPLLMVLAILGLVFAVVGAVKANDGKYWAYPLSIDFFKVKPRLPAANS